MRVITAIVVAVVSLQARMAPADPDLQAGKAAYAGCVSCHGAQAKGNAQMKAPRLNHLEPVYIAAQLQKFKQRIRGGEGATAEAVQMAGMAATLGDEQATHDVAVYIASLQAGANAATIEGDAALGADYYNQFCGACHGAGAEGNPLLNSPVLAGSDDWYLLAQLEAFRTGTRGSHPQDRTGKQMRAMAGVLPDEQAMRDVVAFIGTLGK